MRTLKIEEMKPVVVASDQLVDNTKKLSQNTLISKAIWSQKVAKQEYAYKQTLKEIN